MAHAEHAGNVSHRQTVFICLADCLVAVGPQSLGQARKVGIPAAVLLGKGSQAGAGFWGVALGANDAKDGLRYSRKSVSMNGNIRGLRQGDGARRLVPAG